MKKAILFIALSFLSSFGDSLFLFGVPLFLYKMSGQIVETTYVPLIISLMILLTRPLIIKANKLNPLKVVGFGEILMGLVELVILLAFIKFESRWLVIAGVFPLAIIYNFFYTPKFYGLQDYFFDRQTFHFTAWQSAFIRAGYFLGIVLSGYLVTNYGLIEILAIDILSFLSFGIFILYFESKGIRPSKDEVQDNSQETALHPGLVTYSIIFATVSTLFLTWDNSTSISTASKLLKLNLDYSTYWKVGLGLMGLGTGVLASKFLKTKAFSIWIGTILVATLCTLVTYQLSKELSFAVIFFFERVIANLTIPIQRETYRQVELSGGDRKSVEANQFIFTAVFTLVLAPMIFLIENYPTGVLNTLQITSVSILLIGSLGGILIYRLLRKDLCASQS